MEKNELRFGNLMDVLNEYAEEAERIYRERLETDGHRATGNLIDTMESNIEVNGLNLTVYLRLQDYWKYVENGRKPGKWPPFEKILEWIRIKPVIPRPDNNGKLPTERQLAFLISRKIGQEGIEAGRQLAATVDDLNREYFPKLEAALQRDAEEYVKGWFGA